MVKAFESTENIESSRKYVLINYYNGSHFIFVFWQTTCHGVLRMKIQKLRPSDVMFAALIKLLQTMFP